MKREHKSLDIAAMWVAILLTLLALTITDNGPLWNAATGALWLRFALRGE